MDIGKKLNLAGSQFKTVEDYLRDIDSDLTALYLLSQGHVSSSNIGDDSLLSWTSSISFSSTDEDTVAWGAGSIVLGNGTTYSIGANNTGNMTALTYIYLDKGTSLTELQTSTTSTDAVGDYKILIAVAENNAGYDATFQVFNGSGGIVITTANISTGAITANEVATNTLTAETIAASAITTEELAALSVTADKISANAITTVKIEASAVTAQEIAVDTIQATHMHANAIYTDAIQADAVTAAKIAADAITATNIQANAINASHINVSELSAISASMGTITSGEVIAASIRTANSGTRVVMDTDGLVGYDATLGQVFRIPTSGAGPTFASGTIISCVITDTTIYSDSFFSSSTLPYIEITSNGIGHREAAAGGLYNTFNYGDGTLYGTGLSARIFNTGEPTFSIHKERAYSDIRLYNRSAHSSGASVVGDLEVKSGVLYLCTTAGTPGTFTDVGGVAGASLALDNLASVAINTTLGDVLLDKINGNTFYVGATSTYTTITLAMAAAAAGDTILVAEGTYAEAVTFSQDNLTLKAMGSAENTIISQATATAVNMSTKSGCVIDGFTVIVSAANGTTDYCVTSANDDASAFNVIKNCILDWDATVALSGTSAINVSDGNIKILNNYITQDDTYAGTNPSMMFGIYASVASAAIYYIDGNTIEVTNAATLTTGHATYCIRVYNIGGKCYITNNNITSTSAFQTNGETRGITLSGSCTYYVNNNNIISTCTSTGTSVAIQCGADADFILYAHSNLLIPTTSESDGGYLQTGASGTIYIHNNTVEGDGDTGNSLGAATEYTVGNIVNNVEST